MKKNEKNVLVDGVWGNYLQEMVKGMWLKEGGKQDEGEDIDNMIKMNKLEEEEEKEEEDKGKGMEERIDEEVEDRGGNEKKEMIVGEINVVKELIGNSENLEDNDESEVIEGMEIDKGMESMEEIYIEGI